ncbi:4'-phosphopantetheinyl transferase superfamily protein [Streptomyces sp. NPDC097619]|uniref:4'-phosphopantetheinyl transferase family protein n=1 Tax=Streptomyces sp. NPDC097619 TaxID=3157228 RepID=UPI0033225F21
MIASVLGEPIEVAGGGPTGTAPAPAAGGWSRVRAELHRHGSALLHGRLADWRPRDEADPALRAVLGRDWDRYRGIEHPDIRGRYAASRLLLKHAAAGALSADPADLELTYGPTGRPYLRGCDQIDISLSHTDDLLLVGLTTRGLIGVDAELAGRQLYRPGLDRHICTPQERRDLAALDEADRNPSLVRLWTLKEAYSKAIGQGMQFRFTEFGFGPDGRPTQVLRPDGTPGAGDEWSFRTYTLHSGGGSGAGGSSDGGGSTGGGGGTAFCVSAAVYDAGFGRMLDTEITSMLDAEAVEAIHLALAGAGPPTAAPTAAVGAGADVSGPRPPW